MSAEFMTLQDVADTLRLSYQAAWRIVPDLHAQKVDGRLLITATSVHTYITTHILPALTDTRSPGMPTDTHTDVHLYTLAEVARRTGRSLRSLMDGARDREFEHVHFRRRRYMTEAQILKLIDSTTVTPDAEKDDDADLAAERERYARQHATKPRTNTRRTSTAA